MGYFRPGTLTRGVVVWRQGSEKVAAIELTATTWGEPSAVLSYSYKGKSITERIELRFKASNMIKDAGYYYFVCPVTGKLCRKLYLVNGKFISRTAFNPLYEKQTRSKRGRSDSLAFLNLVSELEKEDGKFRHYTYKGRLTPYGRRCEKMSRKALGIMEKIEHRVKVKGWNGL